MSTSQAISPNKYVKDLYNLNDAYSLRTSQMEAPSAAARLRSHHSMSSTHLSELAASKSSAPSKASQSAAASYESMKDKRAWDLAISPAKSLPMQAFMLYMSGGGVQIFSMGIVFMLLLSPFKNLAAINTGAWLVSCVLCSMRLGLMFAAL
ncbi:hypothetical protein EIP86_010935 [Pleurotus ostreatoroseus]|nr:hypothetical protein EIP86_010935 [Pleurotus ostreatoroseus]